MSMDSSMRPSKHARPHHSRKQSSLEGNVGGIKVVVRTRPAGQFELKEEGSKVCFTVATEETCLLDVQGKSDPYSFTFDRIFGEQSRQIEVFEAIGIPMVKHVLSGFNSTVLVYGQTGAGKTHTMLGDLDSEEMRGLMPRMFEYLFSRIAQEQRTMDTVSEYRVTCSSLEIYNETITDLLTPGSKNLQLKRSTSAGSKLNVAGLKEVKIENTEQALKYLKKGAKARSVSATNANLTSSRSHLVFSCAITRRHKEGDGSEVTRSALLNLVDLAGSESAKASIGKDAKTCTERVCINKSLTCLGRVIDALRASQKKGDRNVYVPYRDSKLTSLLQESLGGNAKTTIIAGISPMYRASAESLSTLQFAQRAALVQNKAKANESIQLDAQALRVEVLRLRSQIEKMQQEGLSTAGIESGSGNPDPEMMESAQLTNKTLQDENNALREKNTELQRKVEALTKQSNHWEEKFSDAKLALEIKTAELHTVLSELGLERLRVSDLESSNNNLTEKLREMENVRPELDEKIGQAVTTARQFERAKRDLSSENEVIESERVSIEEELIDCGNLSQMPRVDSRPSSAGFNNKENFDLEWKPQTRHEEKAAHDRLREQIERSDARLAEAAQSFQENTQELADMYRKTVEELQLKVENKESELRDQSRVLSEEMASLKDLLQKSITRLDAQAEEKEKSVRDALLLREKEMKNQVRDLEDRLAESKATIEDKDSTIAHLERRLDNLVKSSEAKLKKETSKLKLEIEDTKAELETVTFASEAQLDGLERELEKKRKQFSSEIRYKDQRISILEQQLGETDEHLQHVEDYNRQMHHTNQLNDTLFDVLQNINNTLATVDHSRPQSAASSFNTMDVTSLYDA